MSGYKDSWGAEMKEANPFPRRAGHEPAGTVVEVGKLVKGFRVGDRITGYFADDAYCEYVAVDPTRFAAHRAHGMIIEKIADGVPFEYALGEPLMSCMSIARTTTPEFGDFVFQIGAGFMGLGIIAGVSSPKLREYIVADLDDTPSRAGQGIWGHHHPEPLQSGRGRGSHKLTGGRGVDVAIEVVGHPIGIKMTGDVVKANRGKVILVGWHQAPNTYELFNWIKCPIIYSPQGIGMSTNYQSELERAMWALEKGIFPMNQLVTHKYKLEDIGQAFEANLGTTPGYIKGVVMPFMS